MGNFDLFFISASSLIVVYSDITMINIRQEEHFEIRWFDYVEQNDDIFLSLTLTYSTYIYIVKFNSSDIIDNGKRADNLNRPKTLNFGPEDTRFLTRYRVASVWLDEEETN